MSDLFTESYSDVSEFGKWHLTEEGYFLNTSSFAHPIQGDVTYVETCLDQFRGHLRSRHYFPHGPGVMAWKVLACWCCLLDRCHENLSCLHAKVRRTARRTFFQGYCT